MPESPSNVGDTAAPDNKLIDASQSTILPGNHTISEEMPKKKSPAQESILTEDTHTNSGQCLVPKIQADTKMLRMSLAPQ